MPHSHAEQRQTNSDFDASAYRPGSLPPNPAYEEFQREYAARYAPYSEPTVSRRRKGFRAIHMALIFTLGAAAGLTGAWWADSSDPQSAATSPVPGIVSAKPDLPPYEELIRRDGSQGVAGTTGAQGVRGIRSGELPYDGKPPTRGEAAIATAPAAPLSSAANSSGSSDEEESTASMQRPEAALAANAATAAASSESTRKSAALPEAAKNPPVASAGRAAGSEDGQGKDVDGKTAASAASSKRTTVAKNAKDQEIERIRRQADDELKKKGSAPRRADEARNAPRVAERDQDTGRSAATLASSNNYKVMLAQCEAAPNIFRREQCKWQLCNGKWGKNGCPSYSKPNNFYNY